MVRNPFAYNLVRTEWITIVICVLVCLLLSGKLTRSSSFRRVFDRIAAHRGRAVLIVFLLTLLLRIAIWPVLPIHNPGGHDEFSYLLLADTFAHGRIANPTHPLWVHFESFHIVQQPVYVSVYPVAQGLFMAAGQVVAHAPWLGVWISVALMCAALCWMLQGWLPPSWAFAGGLLAAVRLGSFSYWMNSYLGGAVAALGASLMLGALPRMARAGRSRHALIFALGIALLANSRPYEGAMLCVPVAIVFLLWLCRCEKPLRWLGLPTRRADMRTTFARVLLPIFLVLGITGGAMAYYFNALTGSPLKMPATVEREQYGVSPAFLFQTLRPKPNYSNPQMERFYAEFEPIVWSGAYRIRMYWKFYLGPTLLIPLFMVHRIALDRRTRLSFILVLWAVPTLGLERWANPHYLAPFVPPLYAILLQGCRHWSIALKRRPRRVGLTWGFSLSALRWVIPMAVVSTLLMRIAVVPLRGKINDRRPSWASPIAANDDRARLLQQIQERGGKHLIIVRYAPDHDLNLEWVYNDADIDGSQVVWAREMDSASNAHLTSYFSDRNIWLLDVDNDRKLSPYRAATDFGGQ